MRRSRRFGTVAVMVGVLAITLAACSSNSSSSTSSTGANVSVKSGGTVTVALDENLSGFNINTTAANSFVLQEILDIVWPQPYIVNAGLKPVLNTQLISSVKVASNPQVITYNINPKAVWGRRHADRPPTTSSTTTRPRAGTCPTPTSAGSPTTPPPPPATTRSPRSPAPSRPEVPPVPRDRRPIATPVCARTARPSPSSTPLPSPTGKICSSTWSRRTSLGLSAGTPGSPVRPRPSRAAGMRSRATTTTSRSSWSAIRSTGALRASWTRSSSSSSPTTPRRCPALQNNEVQVINPTSVSTSIVQSGVPGAQRDPGDRPGVGVRPPGLQPGQPVPVAAPGPPGHRLRDQPASRSSPTPWVEISRPGLHVPLGDRMFVATQKGQYVDNGSALRQSAQSVQGRVAPGRTRVQERLRRLRHTQLWPAERAGPHLHRPVHLGQYRPRPDRAALPVGHEGDRHQDRHPELRRRSTFFGTNLPDGQRTRSPSFAWVSTRRSFPATSRSTARTPTPPSAGSNWIRYANPAGRQA